MSVLITMVGSSLITNYRNVISENIKAKQYLGDIDSEIKWLEQAEEQWCSLVQSCTDSEKLFGELDDIFQDRQSKSLKNKLKKWITQSHYDKVDASFQSKTNQLNVLAAAEIASIVAFDKEMDSSTDVVLIAYDTITSILIAEVLKDILESEDKLANVYFRREIHRIAGLQITDSNRLYQDGIFNLIGFIMNQMENASERECFLNITGGYKGIIPTLTTIHQIYNIPMTYLFEETNQMVWLPKLPLQFDWSIMERLMIAGPNGELDSIGEDSANRLYRRGELDISVPSLAALFEYNGRAVQFTRLGNLLWRAYLDKYYPGCNFFYMNDSVYKDLLARTATLDFLSLPMATLNSEYRKADGAHCLYTNTGKKNGFERAYYVESNGRIYVYFVAGSGPQVDGEVDHDKRHVIMLSTTNGSDCRKQVLADPNVKVRMVPNLFSGRRNK